jgi:peptidoglycan/xylan/chitin deacetylase (PgdA/CDA1 family)
LFERLLQLSRSNCGAVILYHRVDDPPGDPGRHISPSLGTHLFEAQLKWLRDRFDMIPACDLLARVERGSRRGRIPVAVTFDDDLASHRRFAMPILQDLSIPATFFLNGSSLDRPSAYWWERLERAALQVALPVVVSGGIAPELEALATRDGLTIHAIGRTVASLPREARRAFDEQLARLAGPDPPEAGLRTEDVRVLSEAGFEIGFHTRGHDVLTGLDDVALAHAMEAGRGDLEAVVGRSLDLIAYPHGKADRRVASAARAAGFVAGFVARNGLVHPGADPLLVDRLVAPIGEPSVLRRGILRGVRAGHKS